MKKSRLFSVSRFASIVLVVSLLTTSTPAAPRTIVDFVDAQRTAFGFWYYSSGLSKLIQGRGAPNPRQPEKQGDRDAKVERIEISPGNVTIDLNQRVNFVAVAYDADGNTVGGVRIKWSAQGTSPPRRLHISPHGEFEPKFAGVFIVTAQAAGRSAQTTLTVRPGASPNLNSPVLGHREVSTRDLPTRVSKSQDERNKSLQKRSQIAQVETSNSTRGKRSHASNSRSTMNAVPLPQGGGGGWNDSNYLSADDPENRVGDPPGATADGGAGSGNFQFAAPIYSAAGRGINMSLGLSYNSRVWNKADSQMSFDNDRGWPSPGFNLGFGKILGIGVYTGCMIVDADGTRHSYSGNITIYNWGTYGVMHTTDGSFIDYTYYTGTNGVMLSAEARLPNGTVIEYGAYSQPGGGLFPTYIEDANGNYITISYVNNSGPRIQTVTDTLGRVINFNYDSNSLLTAITAPGVNGGTRTLVRLHYRHLSLNYSFTYPIQSVVVQNSYPWVLDAIYYPGTQTGYWLSDYSTYGMLRKVVEERGMTFSENTPLTDMGTVWEGSVTKSESYNYPAYVGDSSGTQSSNLTDAPTYATMRERWTPDGGSTLSEAVTGYDVNETGNPRTTTITLPNGTKSKQFSNNAPGQWNDGLVVEDRTFTTDEEHPLQKSTSEWEQGAYGAPRPTRIKKFDELNNMTKAEFLYGSVYNQVTEVDDYDYGGTTVLRKTQTTYQNAANYTNRHIFNLPLSVEIYDGNNNRASRTDYQYDGQTLTDAPDVVMHSEASDPYAPTQENCDWVCHQWDYWWIECTDWEWDCTYYNPYNPATAYRGNVTQVTNYADAGNLTGAVTGTKRYDITGNMVTASTSCCEQTTFTYSTDYQYAYPQSQTRGSATDWHAQILTTTGYDFNTGLATSATDANGRPSSTEYDPNTLRVNRTTASTGAHTDYEYNDADMKVTATTYLASGGIADQNVKYLNGRAQVRIEKARGPDSSGNQTWDQVDTAYDNLGQVNQQSKPYKLGQESPVNNTVTYDALGRTRTVTAPDGSVTQSFYNETTRPDVASNLPGETTRVQDAWGRERWGRTDASGRQVEVVEPVFWGSGSVAAGMQTTYAYNTLGNLTQIVQGAQTRAFKYDSLGRLTAQKLAEMDATINDSGTYVGIGGSGAQWSDYFRYENVRSNLIQRLDARGVKTNYWYFNSAGHTDPGDGRPPDPLNRLQSISWDRSLANQNLQSSDLNYVLNAETVTYQYRQKTSAQDLKDVTQLETVTTANVSAETYNYDVEGRTYIKSLLVNGRPAFDTTYSYDSLDRVTDVLYPAEYGNGSPGPRRTVHHDYDIASRLSGLTFNGQTQASNITYNAASQTTSLKVGTQSNEITENYSYNAQTGLLESQTVAKTATPSNYLLNLSYDYVGANGKRTGQLTKIYNNLDNVNKDRGFEYDALGRLIRATGGQGTNNIWAQRYEYDRYGNRSNVYSFGLEDYVRNFYQGAYNRQPNSTELSSALSTLRSAYGQGQSQFLTAMQNLGESLFNSSEYAARGRDNHWYVYDLYKAYLYREPDGGGWANWETMLNNGSSRAEVRNNFAWAPEFYTKVAGISPYAPPVAVPRDGAQGIGYDQATNRIANEGWSYDAAGNQTRTWSNGVWQKYQYDAANRLVKVKNDSDVTIASYTHGSSNERLIGEEFPQGISERTYYVSEGGTTIAEYRESGAETNPTWSKSYVYLGNRLLSTMTPNGGGEAVEYHHPDRLGTRIITNPSTGSWSEQVTLPFGTALDAESSGTASKRRFTSYDRSDITKLDYAVNRHYDSQQGRFTQVDPAGIKATSLLNPQTLNLYTYCTNDPVNRTDPNGLGLIHWIKKHWKIILLAVAVAVTILLVPGAQGIFSSLFQKLGFVVSGSAAEGGGMPTWLKVVLGGAIAAGIFALGIIAQRRDSQYDTELKKTLKKRLKSLYKGQCKTFLKGLLKELARSTGNPTVSDDFLKVFDKASVTEISGTKYTGLTTVTPFGAIIRINLALAKPGGENPLDGVIIHETAHAATRYSQGYSEFQIASAAFTVGKAMGLVPDAVIAPNKDDDDYSNLLFDQIALKACGPYPTK